MRHMQERSDEQLMAAVMAGDQGALAVLVTRHHAPLLGYLYRLVGGDQQLSEDLVQETLLHVLRQRTYQATRPFKPWLYAIATNLARDYFKSAAVRQGRQSGEETEVLLQFYDNTSGPQANYQVSSMVNQMNGITLRIVSATRPHEAAVVIEPSLEDAYLLATSGQAVRV